MDTVRESPGLEGHAEAAAGGGGRSGTDLHQPRFGRNGLVVPVAGDRPHSLLDARSQRHQTVRLRLERRRTEHRSAIARKLPIKNKQLPYN